MKEEKKVRASICNKCGTVLSRKPGEKPPLCKCGNQMSKAKLTPSAIKKGKISVEELKEQSVHPKHPDRITKVTVDSSPDSKLNNFRLFLSGAKSFIDLSNWWESVFPGEDYPEDKPWMLIVLRIEYKLQTDAFVYNGQALSASQLINYSAVMEFKTEKLSPLLKNLIDSYEQARKSKSDREEAKLLKESK